MNAALLAIVLSSWSGIAQTYPIPPAVVEVRPLDGPEAVMNGFLPGGEVRVLVDPEIASFSQTEVRRITAHEAAHALLRLEGVPYMGLFEENLANSFSYCLVGDPTYIPIAPCETVLAALR